MTGSSEANKQSCTILQLASCRAARDRPKRSCRTPQCDPARPIVVTDGNSGTRELDAQANALRIAAALHDI